MDDGDLKLIKQLVERLERLSADSTYAHQASGLRGSLLRTMERIETGKRIDQSEIKQLVELGYKILGDAASEIGGSR